MSPTRMFVVDNTTAEETTTKAEAACSVLLLGCLTACYVAVARTFDVYVTVSALAMA